MRNFSQSVEISPHSSSSSPRLTDIDENSTSSMGALDSIPTLQQSSTMTPVGAPPLLRAQRSFFRSPGDAGGGLEELPQINTDSPGFGIEATVVFSPDASPTSASSSSMDSLLLSDDGRRLKVSTLTGPELFYVFRKKLSGVATLMFLINKAMKRKRLMKIAGFSLMKSFKKSFCFNHWGIACIKEAIPTGA
jgi:hypothetical protein